MIAKLAQLRDSGALTEEEFQREKAELLGQMLRAPARDLPVSRSGVQ
jgi:hypothetical protein